jgi:hypothetical protein
VIPEAALAEQALSVELNTSVMANEDRQLSQTPNSKNSGTFIDIPTISVHNAYSVGITTKLVHNRYNRMGSRKYLHWPLCKFVLAWRGALKVAVLRITLVA